MPQRVALDVFHRDERLTAGRFTERVDDADVGMVERGGRARFLLEAARARVVGAELPADLVATELRSRGESHGGCGDYMRALEVDGGRCRPEGLRYTRGSKFSATPLMQ